MNPEPILKEALSRLAARKLATAAIQKDSAAYSKTVAALRASLTRAWDSALRAALTDALETLADIPPGAFTAAEGEVLLAAMEARLGEDALRGLMSGPVLDSSAVLYDVGWREVRNAAARTGVDIQFGLVDRKALALTQQSNLFWVGNSWNSYTDTRLRGILADFYEQGLSRRKVAEALGEAFAGEMERGAAYWDLLADHIATKTKEIGRIGAYETAGAEYIEVRAHLDAGTTEICRAMHGKIIPTASLSAQRDAYLAATSERNAPAAKRAWKMWTDNDDLSAIRELPTGVPLSTAQVPAGTALPPYHFRCRTITVVHFRRAS